MAVRLLAPGLALALLTSSAGEAAPTKSALPAAAEHVVGEDAAGVPATCRVTSSLATPRADRDARSANALPSGTRGWECIPSVVRADGVETFRVEIDVNGPVQGVTMTAPVFDYIHPPAPWPVALRDDGVAPDVVAGDRVFTAGPFRFNTAPIFPFPDLYAQGGVASLPDSAPGVQVYDVGTVRVLELSGQTTEFLVMPQVGFLNPGVPSAFALSLSPEILASQHVINVRTTYRATQRLLHVPGTLFAADLTNAIYQVLPDAVDFFMLFSTDRIEQMPRLSGTNYVAGVHLWVRQDYTGADGPPFDDSALFGSAGRLLGINALDSGTRGIWASNATHELVHQWAAQLDGSFGLSDGDHYKFESSAASLVGGTAWVDQGDGTFTLDCSEGSSGAHHAPPLDKYMMGLIDGSSVGPLWTYDNSTHPNACGNVACYSSCLTIDNVASTVRMDDIQAVQGVREPGPEAAQRAFTLGFVAESHNRLLTATEMTFYEILAQHYTKVYPPIHPDPYVGSGWVPISRFFGGGTAWSSIVPVPGGHPAGRVPDGSLSLAKRPDNQIQLTWASSCLAADTDYEIYEGVLGDFTSHAPLSCSVGGATSWTFRPASGSTYYLIVPRSVDREGSYGTDGDGRPRLQSSSACLFQREGACD